MYCLDPRGKIIWSKSREEVPHGQALWAGNFMPDRSGTEIIILKSGHYGDFITVDAVDGSNIAEFQHEAGLKDDQGQRKYPDLPKKINWVDSELDSLWIPVDRRIVDGYGHTVQELDAYDNKVKNELHCGTSKDRLAAQAIAIDICGDDREELILYQPYHGEKIYIFTQPESSGFEKEYIHSSSVYNLKSYF